MLTFENSGYKINLDEIPNMVWLLIEYKYNYKNNII